VFEVDKMKEFKDKVAVITGAASGIGRAIARKCVEEGMKVVLSDINEQGSASASVKPCSLFFLISTSRA